MSLHSVRKLAKFVGTTGPLLARHQSPADQAKLHEYGRRLRNKTPTLSEFDVNPENSRQRASLRTSLTSNYHPDLAWGLPDCMRELIQNLVDCWFKEARHALGITRPVFTNKQEGSVHFLLVGDLDKPARTPVAVGAVELRKQDNTILIHQAATCIHPQWCMLGTSKAKELGGENAGRFGEGFKLAVLRLLRMADAEHEVVYAMAHDVWYFKLDKSSSVEQMKVHRVAPDAVSKAEGHAKKAARKEAEKAAKRAAKEAARAAKKKQRGKGKQGGPAGGEAGGQAAGAGAEAGGAAAGSGGATAGARPRPGEAWVPWEERYDLTIAIRGADLLEGYEEEGEEGQGQGDAGQGPSTRSGGVRSSRQQGRVLGSGSSSDDEDDEDEEDEEDEETSEESDGSDRGSDGEGGSEGQKLRKAEGLEGDERMWQPLRTLVFSPLAQALASARLQHHHTFLLPGDACDAAGMPPGALYINGLFFGVHKLLKPLGLRLNLNAHKARLDRDRDRIDEPRVVEALLHDVDDKSWAYDKAGDPACTRIFEHYPDLVDLVEAEAQERHKGAPGWLLVQAGASEGSCASLLAMLRSAGVAMVDVAFSYDTEQKAKELHVRMLRTAPEREEAGLSPQELAGLVRLRELAAKLPGAPTVRVCELGMTDVAVQAVAAPAATGAGPGPAAGAGTAAGGQPPAAAGPDAGASSSKGEATAGAKPTTSFILHVPTPVLALPLHQQRMVVCMAGGRDAGWLPTDCFVAAGEEEAVEEGRGQRKRKGGLQAAAGQGGFGIKEEVQLVLDESSSSSSDDDEDDGNGSAKAASPGQPGTGTGAGPSAAADAAVVAAAATAAPAPLEGPAKRFKDVLEAAAALARNTKKAPAAAAPARTPTPAAPAGAAAAGKADGTSNTGQARGGDRDDDDDDMGGASFGQGLGGGGSSDAEDEGMQGGAEVDLVAQVSAPPVAARGAAPPAALALPAAAKMAPAAGNSPRKRSIAKAYGAPELSLAMRPDGSNAGGEEEGEGGVAVTAQLTLSLPGFVTALVPVKLKRLRLESA